MTGKTMVSCCGGLYACAGLRKFKRLFLCLVFALLLLAPMSVWALNITINADNDTDYEMNEDFNHFTVDNDATYELSGDISGSGAFVKLGPGGLYLSGTNTYTGMTRVSAGLLKIADWDSIDADNTIMVTNGALLESVGDLHIAHSDGGTGNLQIINTFPGGSSGSPSSVTATGNVYVGFGTNSTGKVFIEAENTLTAGNVVYVGYEGAGILSGGGTVVADAVIVNEKGAITPGDAAGEIGTLTIDGDAYFDGATLIIDLDNEAEGQKADLIAITGDLIFGAETNIIDINTWSDGAYVIATADSVALNGKFEYTYRNNPLTIRQHVIAGTNGDGDKLLLGVNTKNLNMSWRDGDTWDATTPWDVVGESVQETFMEYDYVVFDAKPTDQTVNITNATDENVTVSGMLVSGGNYTFTGVGINGVLPVEDNHQVVTGRLDVIGGANVNFQNAVSFGNGVIIDDDSSVTISGQGSIDAAIYNLGTLTFNADAADLSYNGNILGSGDVVIESSAIIGTTTLEGSHLSTGSLDHRSGILDFSGSWGGSYKQDYAALLSVGDIDRSSNMAIAGDASLAGYTMLHGNISVGGNLVIHGGASLDFNFSNSPTASTINVQGALSAVDYADNKITLDFGTWWSSPTDQQHVIMTAEGGISSSFLEAFAPPGIPGYRLYSTLKISADSKQLILYNHVDNRDLVWIGSIDGDWRPRADDTGNWVEMIDGSPVDERFVKWDHVTFDGNADITDITVHDYSDPSVQFVVAGMAVTGGNYTFTGTGNATPAIYGKDEEQNGQTVTQRLNISTALNAAEGTTVTFKNLQLHFANGIFIGQRSQVTMQDKSEFKSDITNNGTIIYDGATAATHSSAIIGGTGDLIKRGEAQLNFSGNAAADTGIFTQEQGNVSFTGQWGGNYVQTATAGTLTLGGSGLIGGAFTQQRTDSDNGAGAVTLDTNFTINGKATFNAPKVDDTNDSSLSLNNRTLTVGSLELNSSYINTTITGNGLGVNTNAGRIVSNGNVSFNAADGKNTINISHWDRGSYLLISGNVTNGENVSSLFNNVLVNGTTMAGGRVKSELVINDLGLVLNNTVTNTNLTWAGTSDNGSWSMNSGTWKNDANADDVFVKWDYVTFNKMGDVPQNISVNTSVTEAGFTGDFEVAGMKITGGEYTFSGSTTNSIIKSVKYEGDESIENDQNTTYKLEITGSAAEITKVTFNNLSLQFANGITIDEYSEVTITDGASLGTNTHTVENQGAIVYNNTNALTHASTITGSGSVTKNGAGALTFSGNGSGATGDFTQNTGNVTFSGSWGGNYILNGGDFTGQNSGNIAGNFTQNNGAGKVTSNGFIIKGNAGFNGTAQQAEADYTASLELSNGALTVEKNVTLHNSNISFTLNAQNKDNSGKISSDGTITFTGNNVINLTQWQTGTFALFSGSGIIDWAINLDTDNILVDGKALVANRQNAEITLSDFGTALELVTSINNVNLIWQNAASTPDDRLTWNTAQATTPEAGRWVTDGSVSDDMFWQNDYVIFKNAAEEEQYINVSENVTVSGMEISGGDYYFTGSSISGLTDEMEATDYHKVTKTLAVSGVDTTATFSNTLNGFEKMTVGAGSTVSFIETGDTGSGVLIENDGHLIYNRDQYTALSNVISGTGRVTKLDEDDMGINARHTATGTFDQMGGAVTFWANSGSWEGNYHQNIGQLDMEEGTYIGGDFFQSKVAESFNAADGVTIGKNSDPEGTMYTATFGAKIILGGTLNVGGNLVFNGALWNLGLGDDNQSDNIAAGGAVDFMDVNSINLDRWAVGEFAIITSETAGGINYMEGDFGSISVNDMAVGSRQSATLQLGTNEDGNSTLYLITGSYNKDLTWTGLGSNVWNTTAINNWIDADDNIEQFNHDDYVIFDATGANRQITVGSGVQVSGMLVEGGDYIFEGGSITGVEPGVITGQTVTGKLEVEDGAKATFKNSVSFVNGINIAENAEVELGDNGSFADTTAITNQGTLTFNLSSGQAYTQTGTINDGAVKGVIKAVGEGTFTLSGTQNASGRFEQSAGQVVLATGWKGDYEQTGGRLSVGNVASTVKHIAGNATFGGTVAVGSGIRVNTLTLNNAILEITVANGAATGQLASTGAVTFGGLGSTIDLSVYESGTYTILTSDTINGINYTNGYFKVTAGGEILGNRQSFEIEVSDDGRELYLTTATKSLDLVWTGEASNLWTIDSEAVNWENNVAPFEEDAFNPMDYVIFNDTGLAAGTVTIADETVVVAGMEVDADGTYIFEGGAIESPDPDDVVSSGQQVTGKLNVKQGQAIFRNALDFARGLEIAADAIATLEDGAVLAETMDIAIEGDGLLQVDRATDLELASTISGAGDIQKDGTGLLTLAADNIDATGLIEHNAGSVMVAQTWGGDYVQNTTAATLIGGNNAVIAGDAAIIGTLETAGEFNIGGDLLLDGATLKISVNRNGQSDLLDVTGSVDFGDPVTLNLRNWKDSDTGYEIVTAGTLNYAAGDIDESNILVNGLPVGSRQEIEFEVIGDSLWVSGTTDNMDIEWAGGSGNWNTTDANWREAGTTDPEQYNTNDYVIFNNNETATINVEGDSVQVSGMLVESGNYTFTGSQIDGNDDASTSGHTVTGKIEITNDAEVTFANTVDFVNGMEIDTLATVTVADKGLLAEAMDIENLGTLIFNRSEGNDYVFNNTLTGDGDVLKNGAGLLTLTGNMTDVEGDLLHNDGALTLATEWGGNYVQDSLAGTFTAADGSAILGDAELAANVVLEGELTVAGETNLDGATVNYSNLGEPNAGKIVSGSITFGDTVNTINVNGWQSGTYTIMEAASIDDITNKFGKVLIDGKDLGNRQKAELQLNGATQLQLIALSSNLDIVWTGGIDGKWDTKIDTVNDKANWIDKESGNIEEFNANDYVIFNDTAQQFNVTVGGDRATTAGMLVESGNYLFSGSAIVGVIPDELDDVRTVTGRLDIMGGSATFMNAIDFVEGVQIAKGATLTMANGADFAKTMNVVNEGVFNLGKGDTTMAGLSGAGGVVRFQNIGETLNITNNLSGSQTFDNVEVNMTEGWADRIVVGGNVEGMHQLNILVSGNVNAKVDTEKIGAIVTALNNKASGTISAGDFEFGAFRYGIHTKDDFTWEVYRIGMGSAGQAILNTHAAVNSAFFGQLDNVNKRMGDLRLNGYKNNGNFWVRAYGRHINGDLDITGVNKFKEDTYGVDMGVDILASTYSDAAFYFGGFGGYARSDRSFKNTSGTDGEGDSVYGGFYGTWVYDGWYVDGIVKAQYFKSSFNAKGDKGDFDNYALGMSVEVGKHILVNDFFLEPSLQVAYAYVANEDYNTNRGLKVKADDANVFQFAGMVRAGADLQTDNGIIQPYIKVGVEAQASSGGHVNFSGERFRPEMDGIRAVFGAGVVWQLDDNVQVHLDYEGAFGSKYNRPFGISAGVRITF